MNWYPRFPGDYMRDTAHLSLTEHGAYTVLLDHYYATGEPLPNKHESLIRVCRAFEDFEKAAVRAVADTFFPVNGDGERHNKRADEELSKAAERSEKARQSAAHRWENERNANAMRTQCSPSPSPYPHPESTSKPNIPPTPQGGSRKKSKDERAKDKEAEAEATESFERAWAAYGRYGSKPQARKYWARYSADERKAIEAAIPGYLSCCAVGHAKKMMQGWLNPENRMWESDWATAAEQKRRERAPFDPFAE